MGLLSFADLLYDLTGTLHSLEDLESLGRPAVRNWPRSLGF